jgi:hypothetical protein
VLYGRKDNQVYSEQKVMVILVKSVHAVTGLHGIKNKTPQFFHKCNLSHVECFMHSYPTRMVVSNINISCILHL